MNRAYVIALIIVLTLSGCQKPIASFEECVAAGNFVRGDTCFRATDGKMFVKKTPPEIKPEPLPDLKPQSLEVVKKSIADWYNVTLNEVEVRQGYSIKANEWVCADATRSFFVTKGDYPDRSQSRGCNETQEIVVYEVKYWLPNSTSEFLRSPHYRSVRSDGTFIESRIFYLSIGDCTKGPC